MTGGDVEMVVFDATLGRGKMMWHHLLKEGFKLRLLLASGCCRQQPPCCCRAVGVNLVGCRPRSWPPAVCRLAPSTEIRGSLATPCWLQQRD